jgi:formylglycine-generating enzyme required for sulfatase activity
MARLTIVVVTLLAAVGLLAQQSAGPGQGTDQESAQALQDLKKAGVCARCHVVSVLEWRISGHLKAGTDCVACHGPSLGHVRNEQNEVKPDRVPRQAESAKLCLSCHNAGCPKTPSQTSCEDCHHVHGLMNPTTPVPRDERLSRLFDRWDQFQRQMQEGERLVKLRNWKAARGTFGTALELMPGDQDARERREMCERRLDPTLPGFDVVGSTFEPQSGLPKEVRVSRLGIAMALVPPGEFDMGADYLKGAQPVQTVRVEAFYLGEYEVTQAQWKALMGTNPSAHQGQGFLNADPMPVEHVSWNDAQALIRKLNEQVQGGGFRLPTEAEWEYAARAGSSGSFQAKGLERSAWYRENSARSLATGDAFQQVDAFAPRPVGAKEPNKWGFYDMQGNVWEWVEDAWHGNYDGALRTGRDGFKATQTAGSSAAVPGATILRLFAPPSGTSATSMSGFNTLGFRVARTLSP